MQIAESSSQLNALTQASITSWNDLELSECDCWKLEQVQFLYILVKSEDQTKEKQQMLSCRLTFVQQKDLLDAA